jgi:uncharacterized protein (DUF2141 family)
MRRLLYVAFLTAALGLPAHAAPAPPRLAATLHVTIDGVTNKGGTLRVDLHDEATFLEAITSPLRHQDIPMVAGDVSVAFERLPPGTYALFVFQDLNNDGRWEMGEPQGVSNGAALNDFDKATLVIEPGDNSTTVHLR